MPRQQPSPISENSAEWRAFLQSRVVLFWKVLFFITLLSSGLGAIGAIAQPGVDFVLVLVASAQAAIFWQLCQRGKRSIRFSRWVEGGGLLLNLTVGGFLGRYLLAGFISDHAIV